MFFFFIYIFFKNIFKKQKKKERAVLSRKLKLTLYHSEQFFDTIRKFFLELPCTKLKTSKLVEEIL